MHATRAAIEEGIVPVGGVALIHTLAALKELKGDNADRNVGITILRRAIEEPLRQSLPTQVMKRLWYLANVGTGEGGLRLQCCD